MVSEIVVTHHDRFCRFAFDLIQYILSLHTTKLMVLFNDATSDEHELSQDILAINTVFICRMQEEPLFTDKNARLGKKRKTGQHQHTTNDNTWKPLSIVCC